MSILYPAGIKREWFDRNPTIVVKSYYNASLAPHSTQTRWTYTCPAGRRAFMAIANVEVMRVTVATTPLIAQAELDVYDGTNTGAAAYAWIIANTSLASDKVILPSLGWLLPGNAIMFLTADTSTGGTCQYNGVAQIVEFDA